MRAEIEVRPITRRVKKGLFKSVDEQLYEVWPNIQFSTEEIQLLDKHRLWERVAFVQVLRLENVPAEYRHIAAQDLSDRPITIVRIAQPDFRLAYHNLAEANEIAQQFEEEVLPKIKGYLTAVASGPSEKRIVEL